MTNATSLSTYASAAHKTNHGYNRFLLLVAGLGGLLYGVDVGIIGGALPYLEATSRLNAGQLSIIVAASFLAVSFRHYSLGCLPTGWAANR